MPSNIDARATDEENERYLQGLCIACGEKPHSAGRTRCNECHTERARWRGY